ncbi:hypothetical protein IMZ11_02710 [Microtetraspora sp. AC03309]|uniref:hypothetical protein n=1 Tax=Microtetraspora sp. AC03309 TaxID=2779376 RepID=UPI001E2B181B|nr:hypothetical protein [Microtetraspora sp. AC03309]MCC5574551.1 hypothetical protein [Microtetraspora sp. AC03309]
MNAIDKIAPYPRSEDEATAEAIAKHFTVFAQLHFQLALDLPDRSEAQESSRALVSYYAIAFLFREVEVRGVGVADRVAKALWESWENPHVLGPDVWAWLEEYGIDPEAVNKIAAEMVAARQAEAAKGGAR